MKINLNTDDLEEQEKQEKETPELTEGERNVENFLNSFVEGKQEEVTMLESSVDNIDADVVIEKPKRKFEFAPIIFGIIFVIFVSISLGLSFIFSTYNVVFSYKLVGATQYNEAINVSLMEKGEFVDRNQINEGQYILYTEDNMNATFGERKLFIVDEKRKNSVHGYDVETKSYKDISYEKICYIVDGDLNIERK